MGRVGGRPRKTEYPDPLPGAFEHGTAMGYNYHGCRCAACSAWVRDTRHRNTMIRRIRDRCPWIDREELACLGADILELFDAQVAAETADQAEESS